MLSIRTNVSGVELQQVGVGIFVIGEDVCAAQVVDKGVLATASLAAEHDG